MNKIYQTILRLHHNCHSVKYEKYEKYEIATYPYKNIINKRSELISKCRHLNKHTLSNYDTND